MSGCKAYKASGLGLRRLRAQGLGLGFWAYGGDVKGSVEGAFKGYGLGLGPRSVLSRNILPKPYKPYKP